MPRTEAFGHGFKTVRAAWRKGGLTSAPALEAGSISLSQRWTVGGTGTLQVNSVLHHAAFEGAMCLSQLDPRRFSERLLEVHPLQQRVERRA
jgi:hypothetical protein